MEKILIAYNFKLVKREDLDFFYFLFKEIMPTANKEHLLKLLKKYYEFYIEKKTQKIFFDNGINPKQILVDINIIEDYSLPKVEYSKFNHLDFEVSKEIILPESFKEYFESNNDEDNRLLEIKNSIKKNLCPSEGLLFNRYYSFVCK